MPLRRQIPAIRATLGYALKRLCGRQLFVAATIANADSGVNARGSMWEAIDERAGRA